MGIGERLKEARIAQGMTAKDFAKRAGVSYPAYINYEINRRIPRADVLLNMAEVLNVSTDYLLGFSASECVDGTEKSELQPIIEEIKEKILHDNGATYNGKSLDDDTRRTLFMDLSRFESDAIFPEKDKKKGSITSTSWGDFLKQVRQEKGLSGAEMARRLGMVYTTYMGYENNRENVPKRETVEKIAKALGVDLETLLPKLRFDFD